MPHFNLCAPLTGAALLLCASLASAVRSERDGLVVDGVDAASPALQDAWLRYRDGGALNLLDWLADGSLLVATPGAAGAQAARVTAPLAAPESVGGTAIGVTDADAHPFDAHRFAQHGVDGRGHAALHVRGPEGAAVTLAEGPMRAAAPRWAHDGRRLAYARGRADGGFDVLIAEPGDVAGAQIVVGDGGRWQVLDWSRDDRSLLLRRELEAGDERLAVADVASGVLTPVDAPSARHPARVRVPAARFTPDGRAVLYLRDDGEDGFVRLRHAELDGSAPRPLTPAMPHDVEHFDVSADGRYLAYTWSEAGYSRLALVDQRAHTPLPVPAELPAGVISRLRFDRRGARLALEVSTATTPTEIDVIDVANTAVTRWAQAPAAGGALQPARRLRFRTWDRDGGRPRELALFLYAPAGPGPHPVLVLLHDGPGGEFRPGYNAWLQFAVNELGIAVVAPNLRGSGGSGRAFAALADGPLHVDATRDIGSLLVWIGAQPMLDAARVAVMGDGEGARQALAALAAFGERLRGAVAIDPPADLRTLGSASALLRPALLAQLQKRSHGRPGDAEQLLWRLRANRREAVFVAIDAQQCLPDCRAAQGAARATIGGYLQGLVGPGAAPELSATRSP